MGSRTLQVPRPQMLKYLTNDGVLAHTYSVLYFRWVIFGGEGYQIGFELDSSDSPALTSRVTGLTGTRRHTQQSVSSTGFVSRVQQKLREPDE